MKEEEIKKVVREGYGRIKVTREGVTSEQKARMTKGSIRPPKPGEGLNDADAREIIP